MAIVEDNYKQQGLRRKLVQQLREKGIKDEAVLAAIDSIPRHTFMDAAFLEHAYEDKAFPIGAGQTISQPYTVAFQSELLKAEKGMKVLEIGTGSGYQTMVLCRMGLKVFSIERQKLLFETSSKLFAKLNLQLRSKFGDGYQGWDAFAPFHRILVTAGAPEIPQKLLEQLLPGGRMIIPVGNDSFQQMLLIEKLDNGEIKISEKGVFRFVPLLKDKSFR